MNLSFLQHIREVTGYVLISHVNISRLVLPNLQIIRGRTVFKLTVRDEEFSLLVTHSYMDSLELPALRGEYFNHKGLVNSLNIVIVIIEKAIVAFDLSRYSCWRCWSDKQL